MADETIILKREELYKLVWSEPVSKLARRYVLSDRGLGKICARQGILADEEERFENVCAPSTTAEETKRHLRICPQKVNVPEGRRRKSPSM